MADSELQVRITARDEASASIETAGRSMEALATRVRTGGQSVAASTREATQTVRALTTGLLVELNPALASSVGAFSLAAREASRLPAAFGTVVVGVAAVSLGLAAMVRGLIDATSKQVDLNLAVQRFDTGAIRSQIRALEGEIARLAALEETGFIGKIIAGFQKLPGLLGQMFLGTKSLTEQLEKNKEQLGTLIPAESLKRLADLSVSFESTNAAAAAFTLGLQTQTLDVGKAEQAERALIRAIEARTAASIASAKADADRVTGAAGATIQDLTAAALAFQKQEQTIKARRDLDIRQATEGFKQVQQAQLDARFRALESQAAADQKAAEEENALALEQQRQKEEADKRALEGAKLVEAERLKLLTDRRDRAIANDELIRASDLETAIAIKDADVDRLAILERQHGLTMDQADALRLQGIEAQRLLEITRADGDARQEATANLRAQVESLSLLQAQAERTDAFAGLARGFQDAAESAGQAGLRMQEFARETAYGMQRSFSDSFFAVITGNFAKLPDIGKQFGLAMVRAVTDQLAQLASAPILRALQQGLGSLGAGMIAPATGAAPGSAPAFDLLSLFRTAGSSVGASQAGTGTAFVSQSTLDFASRSIEAQVGSGMGVGAGAGGGPFDFNTVNVATTAAGAGQAASGFFSPILSQTSVLGTVGSALGAAGAAVALGFTIFNALQGPPTATNIIGSAVSGALSGAVLGSFIYPGIGTLVGLIAGGLLGGGAGFLGKGEHPRVAQRKADRAKVANDIARQLLNAVQGRLDPAASAAIRLSSGNTVGGLVMKIAAAQAQGAYRAAPWNWPADSKYWAIVDALRDLGYHPEEFNVGGVNSHAELVMAMGVPAARQILDAALDRIAAVARTLARIPIAFTEPLAGGGVSRQTFVTASEQGLATVSASGQPTQISPDLLRLLLQDDNAVELVTRRIASVARDRDLVFVGLETFVRA